MYTVVDLFAGAGGLSLGFMQTQKYDIKVAFEKVPHMQDTYRRNHPNVEMQGDVCAADYDDIKRRYGDIDVVIGGPPCQGFSNANRQKNTAINQNNMLVKQYLRAILELQPKAFVMENVSMLRSDVHRFFMEKKDEETVRRCKIPVKDTVLHLLDEKFVFEGALELVQDKAKAAASLWPEEHYLELNVIYKAYKILPRSSVSIAPDSSVKAVIPSPPSANTVMDCLTDSRTADPTNSLDAAWVSRIVGAITRLAGMRRRRSSKIHG